MNDAKLRELIGQAQVLVHDDQHDHVEQLVRHAVEFCEAMTEVEADDGIVLRGEDALVTTLVCGSQLVQVGGPTDDRFRIDVVPLARIRNVRLLVGNVADGLGGPRWPDSVTLTLRLQLDAGQARELSATRYHSQALREFFQRSILPALKD